MPAQSLERLAPAIEDATEFRPERGNPAVFFDGFLVAIESAKHLATVKEGISILRIKLCRDVVFLDCFLVPSPLPPAVTAAVVGCPPGWISIRRPPLLLRRT